MIKKLFIALIALISINIANAQSAVGDWTVYSLFSSTVDKVIDTPSKVFYLSAGSLYSYDKDGNETYFYTIKNKLNDTQVSDIYYNYTNKYLMVIYSSCNIDLIYDNGKVVNMSDIDDAVLTTEKIINDVKFADNRIYVATNFGLVIFDDKKHEVVESGIYGQSVDYIEVVQNNIVICTKYNIMYSPISMRHNTLDKFTFMFGLSCGEIRNLGNKVFFGAYDSSVGGKTARVYTLDFEKQEYTRSDLSFVDYENLQECKNGNFYTYTSTNYYELNSDGEIVTTLALPSAVQSQALSLWEGTKSVWVGGSDGIANMDISSSTTTVLQDYFKPNALNCIEVAFITSSQDGKRLYFSNLGCSQNRTIAHSNDGMGIRQTASMLENGGFTDISLIDPSKYKTTFSPTITDRIISPAKVVESPFDPSITIQTSFHEGVYVVKDRKQLAYYQQSNMDLQFPWGARICDLGFDKDNNLLVAAQSTSTSYPILVLLPAEKYKTNPENVKKSDWIRYKINVSSGKDLFLLLCQHSNMIFIPDTYGTLYAYDHNGTPLDTSDDTMMKWSTSDLVDQDGKTLSFVYYSSIAEDNDGRVWIGTDQGLFEITNPKDALNTSMRVKRLKVPRNDGTNLADYLLSTDIINGIAVDASNRKWIATENSGVYLVSADGDEILENFTASNSYLPTNAVASVFCDKLSNTVYFGTAQGLVSYSGTAMAASEDYSDVYAYPNPVKPDYTGWITIKGLMDNSLVKITDAMGNLVYETKSEGGMVVWDGCNSTGSRVSTGVYYVFASQNESGTTSGAVTKILVVN